jgi:release factor glutamine methyltransferase
MRFAVLPGVFRPRPDSRMLAGAVAELVSPGDRVLDLCTGSGLLAVTAALAGGRATAVDLSRRAVATARLNGRLNGVRVDARRGSLFGPVAGERFDLIVSNPPYIPAAPGAPTTRAARAWDAGSDGRALLDPLCAAAPAHLRPGGALLLVHSQLAGIEATQAACARGGLACEVLRDQHGPLGAIGRERLGHLVATGVIGGDGEAERTAVLLARAPAAGGAVATA